MCVVSAGYGFFVCTRDGYGFFYVMMGVPVLIYRGIWYGNGAMYDCGIVSRFEVFNGESVIRGLI